MGNILQGDELFKNNQINIVCDEADENGQIIWNVCLGRYGTKHGRWRREVTGPSIYSSSDLNDVTEKLTFLKSLDMNLLLKEEDEE